MKSIGLVRKVDRQGKIVLPIEIRDILKIPKKGPLEFYVDGEIIILKKYQPNCIFCGSVDVEVNYKGKNICPTCLSEIKTYI